MNARQAREISEANSPTPNVESHMKRFEGFVEDAANQGRTSIDYPEPPEFGALGAMVARLRARGFVVQIEATCLRVRW